MCIVLLPKRFFQLGIETDQPCLCGAPENQCRDGQDP